MKKIKLKIRVENERHSKEVQNLFFKKEYRWGLDLTKTEPKFTDRKYLFIDDRDMTITYTDDDRFYINEKNFIEIKLLHPLQLKFLKSVMNSIQVPGTVVENTIQNGYYRTENKGFLNSLL